MTRIHPITRDEAAPEVRSIFDHNLAAYGQILNTTGVYAHRPSIQLGARALAEGIASSGLITARLRHLVCVRIASQLGCPF